MALRSVASTDGVTLAVHDLGGRGPEILYSHATGFHGRIWIPFHAHLAERYHGWAVDYRGHGNATRPESGAVTWADYGVDCAAVVDTLGLARPRFGIGHSMGAVSLLMAELTQPGTFAALALYEPVMFPVALNRTDPPPLIEGARRRRAEFASFDAARGNFAAKPPLDVLDPAALDAYVRYGFAPTPDGTVRLRCEPEHEARTYEGGSRHGTFERLADVRCPVLVLSGDPRDIGPGPVAPLVAEQLPLGRHHRFEGLGHFGPLQDPGAVAAVVSSYFAEVAGA